MSRLDWFTILIVSICIACLGFLVYRTIQLMGNEKTALPSTEINKADKEAGDPTAYQTAGKATSDQEAATAANEEDLDDDELTYDPQEVEAPAEKSAETKTEPVTKPAESKVAPVTKSAGTTDKPTSSTPAPATSQPKSQPIASSTTSAKGAVPSSYNSDSKGRFLVVAGSFSQRFNAENQVQILKGLGYKNASAEALSGSTLTTALVDRFSDYEAAKRLASELKGKGVDAFVKTVKR